ncbi:btb/poz domain-containing protein [Anaeramoeba flamelloides]|uniref:Btb/poz domain-containing protein n=1 Tax=Anaeramoeba flamelloides TaxID=1746091 RepID=A0ABQ8XHL2_9EUKA|nr:btb/poz domain-containing protein [Anaeramoeba flamelloides]
MTTTTTTTTTTKKEEKEEKEEKEINFGWGSHSTSGKVFLSTKNNTAFPVKLNKYSHLQKIKQMTQQNPQTLFLTNDNDLYYSKNFESKMDLPDKNEIVKSLSSGHSHSVIVTESNKVYSFGSNYDSQLGHSYQNKGIIDEPTRIDYFTEKGLVVKKSSMWKTSEIKFCTQDVLDIFSGNYSYFHLFLKEEGLFAVGSNSKGQLGIEGNGKVEKAKLIELPMGFEHTSIACGLEHCLILGNSNNSQQQLLSSGKSPQNGHSTNRHKFEPIEFFNDHDIKQISVGAYHSMVLTEEQRIFCFGQNGYSQLGKKIAATCKPTEIVIPEIKNHTNLQIYAGCYDNYVFHSDYYDDDSLCNNYSLLSKDLLQLFRSETNFSDSSVKEVKFHKILVESRIGKPRKHIEQVLNEYPKEQIKDFIEWVYSGKMHTSKQQLIKEICVKFGITDPKHKSLQNDLLILFKDQDSKDFNILVKGDDDDDDEESYEEIPVHKFLLLARSGLFRDMFQNINEKEQFNSVKDYSGKSIESIEVLIEYFYTNTINVTADHDSEFIFEELQDSGEYYQLSNIKHFGYQLKKIN